MFKETRLLCGEDYTITDYDFTTKANQKTIKIIKQRLRRTSGKTKMKRAPVRPEPVGFSGFVFELAGDDVGCTRPFFALSDLELDLLAFIKTGVTAHLDFRMMNE